MGDPAFRPLLDALFLETGVPEVSPGKPTAFAPWFEQSLQDNGWRDPKLISRARRAAEDQLLTTAALRLVGLRAWGAAASGVPGLDVMLIGSIGRAEAGAMSDFDLLFVGPTRAALPPNGMKESDDERTRTDAMRARPWRDAFVTAARAAKYDFPNDPRKPDLKVICVDELWDRTTPPALSSEQRRRHGANALACGHELPGAAGALAGLLDFARRQAHEEYARHRISNMRRYISDPWDLSRPHNVHGFLSQAWQAIVFFCDLPVRPRTPYWRVPTLVPFDAQAERRWANAMYALYLQRQCDADVPVIDFGIVRDAVVDLVRCTEASFGLQSAAAQQIREVIENADAY